MYKNSFYEHPEKLFFFEQNYKTMFCEIQSEIFNIKTNILHPYKRIFIESVRKKLHTFAPSLV